MLDANIFFSQIRISSLPVHVSILDRIFDVSLGNFISARPEKISTRIQYRDLPGSYSQYLVLGLDHSPQSNLIIFRRRPQIRPAYIRHIIAWICQGRTQRQSICGRSIYLLPLHSFLGLQHTRPSCLVTLTRVRLQYRSIDPFICLRKRDFP